MKMLSLRSNMILDHTMVKVLMDPVYQAADEYQVSHKRSRANGIENK